MAAALVKSVDLGSLQGGKKHVGAEVVSARGGNMELRVRVRTKGSCAQAEEQWGGAA